MVKLAISSSSISMELSNHNNCMLFSIQIFTPIYLYKPFSLWEAGVHSMYAAVCIHETKPFAWFLYEYKTNTETLSKTTLFSRKKAPALMSISLLKLLLLHSILALIGWLWLAWSQMRGKRIDE